MPHRIDTGIGLRKSLIVTALAVVFAAGMLTPRTSADEVAPTPAPATPAPEAASAPKAEGATAEAAPAEATPAKRWVWLQKQGLWGYGYQRADGLWVIDPGSKRVPAPARAQAAAPVDPTGGFLGWLNSVRAQMGLAPVSFDPSLASWAAANNVQQQMRGLGHFVMGPARRQNSAMGHAASIGAQWMASPAHRSALLDPSIRAIGLAGLGAYWTFNAY